MFDNLRNEISTCANIFIHTDLMFVCVNPIGLEMIVEQLFAPCKYNTVDLRRSTRLLSRDSRIEFCISYTFYYKHLHYTALVVTLKVVTVLDLTFVLVLMDTGALIVLNGVLARMVPAMMVRYTI